MISSGPLRDIEDCEEPVKASSTMMLPYEESFGTIESSRPGGQTKGVKGFRERVIGT